MSIYLALFRCVGFCASAWTRRPIPHVVMGMQHIPMCGSVTDSPLVFGDGAALCSERAKGGIRAHREQTQELF